MTNILDTVEPVAYGYVSVDGHDILTRGRKLVHAYEVEQILYSRETVESLLEAHRKQVLLEAAEVCRNDESGRDSGGYFADELRRMAEGEK